MSAPRDIDDWVFDTVKQSTFRPTEQQLQKETIKRRKLSRIMSNDDAENAAAMMQNLDINSAPLSSSTPSYSPHRSTTIRTPNPHLGSPTQHKKSSALTARRISVSTPTARRVSRQPSGATPTARRISGHAKQPLGLDMSFGNGTSTVRQFRRVSSANNHQRPRSSGNGESVSISEDLQEDASDCENQHPDSASAPTPVTKESILGRRAYVKCVDASLQESYASTAPGPKQAALAKLAEAWSMLDEADPEGELLLLKSIFEKVQNDPKLAAQIMPTRVASTQLSSLRLASPTKRSSIAPTDKDTLATPPSSPQKRDTTPGTPKLVMAPQNPHLKSMHKQPTVTVDKVQDKEAAMEKNMPGHVEQGLEHVGLLADALYGRWSEGLRMRWPLASS